MDGLLEGKTVFLAASTKGLGYGVALESARQGARVSLGSRNEEHLEEALKLLSEETGADAFGFRLDASDHESIGEWIEASLSHFGTVDCLVTNAGGPPAGFFEDFNDDHWQQAFELTLMSTVRMIRKVLPVMKKKGSGSIVTMTSSSVKEPIDILLLSNVMRSGVTSLAKSLSFELAPFGIRVNNLVPGRFDTDRVRYLDTHQARAAGVSMENIKAEKEQGIPLGRYGTPDEFGKAAAFLLSDSASYITGETLVIDGGAMRTVW